MEIGHYLKYKDTVREHDRNRSCDDHPRDALCTSRFKPYCDDRDCENCIFLEDTSKIMEKIWILNHI